MTSVRTAALATFASTVFAAFLLALPLKARDAATATRAVAPAPAQTEARYALGTVILKLNPHVVNVRRSVAFEVPAIDALMQQIGASARTPLFPRAPYSPFEPTGTNGSDPVRAHGFDRVYIVSYDGPFDAKWVAERLSATQAVEYAEPYYFFEMDSSPVNDPRVAQQYWLSIIEAQEAWDVTQGSSDVLIAIVDSGVEWMHEDLEANIYENPGETGTDGQGNDRRTNSIDDDENGFVDDWHGWDLVGDIGLAAQMSRAFRPDNNPSPRQVNVAGYTGYHGTTVAGCASASTNNGKGIASPGYNSRILPVKAAADTSIQAINAGYEGIVYAADMHATIINCSFGGPTGGNTQAMQQVADYARTQGSLIVAAAGNSGVNMDAIPHVPAVLNGVLSVGATSQSDYADTTYTNTGLSVDVWAPGTNVMTTYINNGYIGNGVTGTSFSSPVTAGVVALISALHPDWSPEQLAMQARVTGDRVKINEASRFTPHFFSRVNARKAVSINRSFESGERSPGIEITSFMINGKFRDSLRSLDDVLSVQLELRNLLAPTTALTIDAWPGQMLRATTEVSVPAIETNGTASVTIELEVDSESAERFSEGAFDLVLRMRDVNYEDVAPVRIPVKLGGWRQQARFGGASTTYATQSIAAASPDVAWAVANVDETRPAFARMIDGKTWQSFRNIVSTTEQVYCVAALDAQTAWAGSSPSSGQASVFGTINGGTSWTKTSVATITPFVNAVHFFDAQNGILLGDPRSGRWGIGTTSDGGATWTAVSPAVTAPTGEAGWNNSYAAFGDNVWFGTNNSKIFRSSDRGRTWTSSTAPALASFSLAFTSPSEGLAVFKRIVLNNAWNGSNAVAITRDGGATWQRITLPFGTNAESATTIPGTTRILVATESGILETEDLGATWTIVPAPASMFNWKASMSGARYGTGVQITAAATETAYAAFAMNGSGLIAGYRESESTTSAPIAGESTARATMLEPFPNPATSSTTIAFDLAVGADISLALFDARGASVATLVEGHRGAGRHAAVIDAATLAAGTYHAVLVVDGERITRQVVIVR